MLSKIGENVCCVNFKSFTVDCFDGIKSSDIKLKLQDIGILSDSYYFVKGGRRLHENELCTGIVQIVPRLLGGKGGFGSMLRAIGAQIEKTTNREACRDLSGRRLRDINEEQRLKNWIAQQAEREREALERKKQKLERLCREPKHDFRDDSYEKERSELTEKVSDSVEEGFKKAGSSGVSVKRTKTNQTVNKKKKLWMNADDEFSSSDDEEGPPKIESKETTEIQSFKDDEEVKPPVKSESKEKTEVQDSDDNSSVSNVCVDPATEKDSEDDRNSAKLGLS